MVQRTKGLSGNSGKRWFATKESWYPLLVFGCTLVGVIEFAGSGTAAQLDLKQSPVATTADAQQGGPPPLPPGPLGDMDQLFVEAYTTRRSAVIQASSPFVVVSGSNLILHRAGQTEKVRVIPDLYHALKDLAHVPFTVYLELSPLTNSGAISDGQIADLNNLLARMEAARAVLTTGGYSSEQLTRQTQILDASQSIVLSTVENKKVSSAALSAFARKMGPLMLSNAEDAGCLQIQGTHAQMMKWKDSLSAAEWNQLTVIDRARHQARYRNAATQYFHWLFQDSGPSWSYPGESMRVIYAESLGPKEDASDELATTIIDADASKQFFNDPWRLTEDILSGGASACIKTLSAGDRVHH